MTKSEKQEQKLQEFCETNKEFLDILKGRWEDNMIMYCKRAFVCDSQNFEDREDYEYYRGAKAAYTDVIEILEKCKNNIKEKENK